MIMYEQSTSKSMHWLILSQVLLLRWVAADGLQQLLNAVTFWQALDDLEACNTLTECINCLRGYRVRTD